MTDKVNEYVNEGKFVFDDNHEPLKTEAQHLQEIIEARKVIAHENVKLEKLIKKYGYESGKFIDTVISVDERTEGLNKMGARAKRNFNRMHKKAEEEPPIEYATIEEYLAKLNEILDNVDPNSDEAAIVAKQIDRVKRQNKLSPDQAIAKFEERQVRIEQEQVREFRSKYLKDYGADEIEDVLYRLPNGSIISSEDILAEEEKGIIIDLSDAEVLGLRDDIYNTTANTHLTSRELNAYKSTLNAIRQSLKEANSRVDDGYNNDNRDDNNVIDEAILNGLNYLDSNFKNLSRQERYRIFSVLEQRIDKGIEQLS